MADNGVLNTDDELVTLRLDQERDALGNNPRSGNTGVCALDSKGKLMCWAWPTKQSPNSTGPFTPVVRAQNVPYKDYIKGCGLGFDGVIYCAQRSAAQSISNLATETLTE